MRKDTVTLSYALILEVDEVVRDCENLGEAIKNGYARIISSDVALSSEIRGVCDDKDVLEQANQAILKALKEEG